MLLRDDLEWPIAESKLEDVSFDYSPEEFGIPADRVPTLVRLRELQPLTLHQPWGIFFLEFAGPRLPITPLRRLLQRLVATKRAGGRHHRTWNLDQLLFIITTDTGDAVEFHLVAFFDRPDQAAEIRSLSWRPRQSPQRYLHRLAEELLPPLLWPTDIEDVDEWTSSWRDAFKLRQGETIRSADRLADRMAMVAKSLRREIKRALDSEGGKGPFTDLLADVRKELVASVDPDRFSDMCAQTLVYGTLTARVTDPIAFGALPSLAVIPLANPFLAALFEQVHDQVVALDLDEEGLEQLAADLRESNVEAVLDQFGSTAKGGDPVVHFYEEFLKAYDPRARIDSGAFYTPQPVVAFMVRAVDEVLRTRFGLEQGLADDSPWHKVARHLAIRVPEGVAPGQAFVSMLDPGAGTGTYLVEWLRRARHSFEHEGSSRDWPKHLREFVLPSMHAFELMLAPYAVSHLKVALEAHDQGIDLPEVAIHLTDTLEYPAGQQQFVSVTDPIAAEGERAAALKENQRFTVIIANPPYDREQKELGAGGRRKGGVVRYGADGLFDPLLDDITEPMKAARLGVHIKNLYNDYVYFWRWSTWQATERPAGPGVVAFITASSYLDGKSMAGLRHNLRKVFDELWIIDLGGEGRGARTEENVFDIRTPVAIAIGVRTKGAAECSVRYRRVSGSRDDKFAWLREGGLLERGWQSVPGTGFDPFTPSGVADYFDWPEVTDLFPWTFPGLKAGRTWVIAPTWGQLRQRLDVLVAEKPTRRQALFKDSPTGRKCDQPLRKTIMPGKWDHTPVRSIHAPPSTTRYGYRSFDRQFIVADPRFLDRASVAWQIHSPHQIYLTTLTSTKLGRGAAATVTPYVPDLHHFSGRGARDVIPLWRDPAGKEPNATAGLAAVLEEELGFTPSTEDLLAYVYGLAGTPAFTERFANELDFGAGPFRVPITTNPVLFREVMELGRELLWRHTWGERFAPADKGALPSGVARQLAPVHGYPNSFNYNANTSQLSVGTGCFSPVNSAVWEFEVSGLKVLQSWLGYRMATKKGRSSSPLDEIHSERWTFAEELLQVVAVLQYTVDVTPQAAKLLGRVVASRLVDTGSLPAPSAIERKAQAE